MNSITVLMCVYEKDNDKHFIDAIFSLKENREYIDQTIIVINGYISDFKRDLIKKKCRWTENYISWNPHKFRVVNGA